jgi:hypothetical protein
MKARVTGSRWFVWNKCPTTASAVRLTNRHCFRRRNRRWIEALRAFGFMLIIAAIAAGVW